MTSSKYIIAGQAGSAVRHVVVLLALALVCYFGVKGLYSRIDDRVSDVRDRQPPLTGPQIKKSAPESGDQGGIDTEAITRRNLFLPASTGGEREGSAPSFGGAESGKPDLLLVGTIIEAGGLNRAVVLEVEQKKQHLLKEGDMINGASVRRIDSGRVIISRRGRTELLDIAESDKLRAAAGGQAAPEPKNAVERGPVPVAEEQGPDSEEQDRPVRVDLNKLGETDGRVLIKGRTSENI